MGAERTDMIANTLDIVIKTKSTEANQALKKTREELKKTKEAIKAARSELESVTGEVKNETTHKGIKSLRDSLKNIGNNLKNGSRGAMEFLSAVKRIAVYRLIRTALKEIAEGFNEGLSNAYEFAKVTKDLSGQRFVEAMNSYASATAQLKNSIGTMASQLAVVIMPTIESIASTATRLANTVAEMLAAWNGEKQFMQAQTLSLEWDNATASVKKYRQQLLGLDELNVLSSGNGSVSAQVQDIYKMADVSTKTENTMNKIKKIITDFSASLTGMELGLGAVLTFSGASIPLGVAMMVHGLSNTYNDITRWGKAESDISDKLEGITKLVAGFSVALGTILVCTGNIPIGAALIAEGALATFGISAIKEDSGSVVSAMRSKFSGIKSYLQTYFNDCKKGLGAVLISCGFEDAGSKLIDEAMASEKASKSQTRKDTLSVHMFDDPNSAYNNPDKFSNMGISAKAQEAGLPSVMSTEGIVAELSKNVSEGVKDAMSSLFSPMTSSDIYMAMKREEIQRAKTTGSW